MKYKNKKYLFRRSGSGEGERKMKKNILKKITAFAAAAALIVCTLLFAGCQNDGKIRISIAQIADHPSLDTIRDGVRKNAGGKRL